MTAPDWERVRALFHDLLDRSPEEQAARLREMGAADEHAAREVASLLAAHHDAQAFLDAPASALAPIDDASEDEAGREELAVPRPWLAAGDRLGAFEILGPAGRGGMGEVYKARDLRLDRIVAIKIVSDRRGRDPRARARFEREARAISRLSHPHICTLHDVGVAAPAAGEPEVPFLVMEFLEGRTLADRLADGPLPPGEALRHALAIADALAAAHAHGIVHRDLKPANVMLTDGGVKLLDFGLAQLRASAIAPRDGTPALSSRSSLSMHGFILGTLRYMSPEQLRGEPTDRRSDIFAFGVVMHEMLTGRPPFDAKDDASVIAAVLTTSAPPIVTGDPRVDARCTPIVRRCLEKSPEQRWARMEDLRAALLVALHAAPHGVGYDTERPLLERPLFDAEPPAPRARRADRLDRASGLTGRDERDAAAGATRPGAPASAGASLVTGEPTIPGAAPAGRARGGATTSDRSMPPTWSVQSEQVARSAQATFSATAAALFARVAAAASSGRLARTAWRVARVTFAAALLLVAAAALFHLTRWRATLAVQSAPARVSIIPPEGVRFEIVQISPDGRKIAFTGWTPEGTRVWMRALDAAEARPVRGTLGAHGPLMWSPDSRELAFVMGNQLVAHDTVAGATRTIGEVASPLTGSWGAEGDILFDGGKSTREGLWRIPASGGTPAKVLEADLGRGEASYMFPHCLSEGRFLFSVLSPDPLVAGVYMGSMNKAKGKRILPWATPVVFLSSGHLLFLRDNAVMAQPFDPDEGELLGEATPIVQADGGRDIGRRILSSIGGTATMFSASQTGTIVHAANPNLVEQLAWYDRGGRRLATLGEAGTYVGFALSRDDARVVTARADGEHRPWNLWMLDLARGTSTRMTFAANDQTDPRWAPDGRRLVVSATGGARERGERQEAMRDPSTRDGGPKALMAVGLDGREELMYRDPTRSISVDDWSPDGKTLLYHVDRDRELLAVPVSGDQSPRLIWRSPSSYAPDQARFSPDGRWVAYHSQDSGQPEIYVTRFPEGGERWRVSGAGGVQPVWRGDGRELFYLGLDARLFVVPVGTGGGFQPAAPRPLFQTAIAPSPYTEQYAVDRAAGRFLLLEPDPRAASAVIDVVLNWQASRPSGITP